MPWRPTGSWRGFGKWNSDDLAWGEQERRRYYRRAGKARRVMIFSALTIALTP
jgi:hypothetical protein